MGKILQISLKLNFTPNILGCYGFSYCGRMFVQNSLVIFVVYICSQCENVA